MRRVILVRPSYFIDLFLVECPEPRRIDWIYRNMGNLTIAEDNGVPSMVGFKSVSLGTSGERGDGYEHISESREMYTIQRDVYRWRCGDVLADRQKGEGYSCAWWVHPKRKSQSVGYQAIHQAISIRWS